ncbi:MAG: hypothetical protein JSW00_13980 [Thermoplasmata archaeon]|nr:MAG: hypothetical protein JSW00_13980 [Thermoplasmata archaeon]
MVIVKTTFIFIKTSDLDIPILPSYPRLEHNLPLAKHLYILVFLTETVIFGQFKENNSKKLFIG